MKVFRYDNDKVACIEAEKISIEELKDSWLDFKGKISENLFGLNFDRSILNEDEYCQIEDAANYSLVKIGYIGKENFLKTIYIILTEEGIITIHEQDCSPIDRFIKNIRSIAKEEKENIVKFKDFVLLHILYEVSAEGMNAISTIDDYIEETRGNLTENGKDLTKEIIKIRKDVRTLVRVILYQSSLVTDLRHGKGEYINAKNIIDYSADISTELDKYGKLASSLEKELDGINQTLESRKISEYTKYTARLNFAIEILTRASVLLMVPNSIFTFWPAIFSPEDLVFGIENYWIEILIAIFSIILSQIVIGEIYRKANEKNK